MRTAKPKDLFGKIKGPEQFHRGQESLLARQN